MLLRHFVVILQKADILTLPQLYSNVAAKFRNRFAILQCFNEIILQYICNLSVLYGDQYHPLQIIVSLIFLIFGLFALGNY